MLMGLTDPRTSWHPPDRLPSSPDVRRRDPFPLRSALVRPMRMIFLIPITLPYSARRRPIHIVRSALPDHLPRPSLHEPQEELPPDEPWCGRVARREEDRVGREEKGDVLWRGKASEREVRRV